MKTTRDLEHAPSSHTPLLDQPQPPADFPVGQRRQQLIKVLSAIFISILFLSSFVGVVLILNQQGRRPQATTDSDHHPPKSSDPNVGWQRTAYHFQPEKNFMSDPNAPLFHMGWYHYFYQYDPTSAVWGNISWGHAVSKNMINWFHLPLAMVPDKWYDIEGVLTGSATKLPDGQIVLLYTGRTYDLSQLQCLAHPANVSDPLLLDWIKYPGNPILFPPPGVGRQDFRDPSTMWIGHDGKWRMAIGSRRDTTGITLMYKTTNFTSYELMDQVLHEVPDTAMWECIDLYPVSTNHSNGLELSVNIGPGVKHVLKESWDGHGIDWYAIGTYDPINDKWTPDDPTMDLGIGLRYDYGRFYASKTFYDPIKKRRLLYGFVPEADTRDADLSKGWASVLNIPRTVLYDIKTGTNILQWPLEEIESLRLDSHEFQEVELRPGSLIPLDIGSASDTQLDISATFEIDKEVLEATVEDADVGYDCTTSSGSAGRGLFGPFGLVALADVSLYELTTIYFYIAKDSTDGNATTYFCNDETRSSKASDLEKRVVGSKVPVLHDENFSMRLLVDHSMVESFGQGGRTVITSRVYPTKAINGAAKLFLFNNATGISVKASVKIWHMGSAQIETFRF